MSQQASPPSACTFAMSENAQQQPDSCARGKQLMCLTQFQKATYCSGKLTMTQKSTAFTGSAKANMKSPSASCTSCINEGRLWC